MSRQARLAVVGRGLCLALSIGWALVRHETPAAEAAVLVLAVGAVSTVLAWRLPGLGPTVLPAETCLVALVVGRAYPGWELLMPYLVVLSVLAGLSGLLSAVLLTVGAQVAGLVAVPLAVNGPAGYQERLMETAPWMLTALGCGLLALQARGLGPVAVTGDPEAHYESAHGLLTQLRSVARRLSAGLDSGGISAQLMETVHETLGDRYGAVFVKTGSSVLTPVGFRGPGASQALAPTDPIVLHCWTDMVPVQGVAPSGDRDARHRTALPLRVDSRMIGVACSSSSEPADPAVVRELMAQVDAHSIRLDTALVFDEIRSLATADERQRLAREIHDGIAQEVASLGYVVDDLAESSSEPLVVEGLRDLRTELSRVVADLRLSIFDLRSDVSPAYGLGAALSDYVRQVGAKSELTVHLTLDEAPTRLTPVVEAELLRIAQEAVTNARKHAAADNLWVDFWTDPPRARLVVRDDGAGISGGRDDSYGISIMRERASRIDATLDVDTHQGGDRAHGTVVQVTVAGNGLLPEEGVSIP